MTCSLSVDYLTSPLEVFGEIHRMPARPKRAPCHARDRRTPPALPSVATALPTRKLVECSRGPGARPLTAGRSPGRSEPSGGAVGPMNQPRDEDQMRIRGGSEEDQRRIRGGSEEEQRRIRGGSEEDQMGNRRGSGGGHHSEGPAISPPTGVLRPGGIACMAFTNRCFPTKVSNK